MKLPQKIYDILKNSFGYESFRFHQEEIISSILNKQDTLAILPTGGGKSLCYQLPALYLDGICIVISPLISLMQDQVKSLNQYGIAACFLNSSQNYEEKIQIKKSIESGEIKIVYVAPEGMIGGAAMDILIGQKISFIAIDEAHCVSQWGHEFRSDYMRLGELKRVFPHSPTIALTATADEKTRQDISAQLGLKNPNVFISSFDRPNIKYMIFERQNEVRQLHHFIQSHHKDDTGIVYCLSRKKVETVCEALKDLGYNAVAYHAGLSAKKREKNQKRFDYEDGLIVVATIAFGMGIDRPDVRFVAHLDLPKSIEGYYQETGRAGRDGKESNAWMIYGLSDVVKLSQMLETTDASEDYKKIARHKLDQMLALCESATCRRQILLDYFGQTDSAPCGNCDTCLEPPELWDATIEAQKLLSTVYRTNQMFGAGHLIDVLRGAKNEKILQRKHDELSVYGIGKDLNKASWNNIIRQLLNLKYLYIKNWEFKSLALAEKSRALLKDLEKVHLRKFRSELTKQKRENKPLTSNHNQPELFEELRTLRSNLAKEFQVPPYIIFNDKTLHDMCHILPRNEEEILLVHGVGKAKFDKYGPEFLSVIENYL